VHALEILLFKADFREVRA
jgi:hypothetical protein